MTDIPSIDELYDEVIRKGIADLVEQVTPEQRDRFYKFYPVNVQATPKREDQKIAYELLRRTIISNQQNASVNG